MFDLLKKKFSNFIGSITKKEKEENSIEAQPTEEQADQDIAAKPQPQQEKKHEERLEAAKIEIKEQPIQKQHEQMTHAPSIQRHPVPESKEEANHAKEPDEKMVNGEIPHHRQMEEKRFSGEEPKQERAHEQKPKISLETKIKGFIFGKVEIKEKDVQDILEDFKLALLESDVNYAVAEKIADTMHKRLVGSKVDSRNIEKEIRGIIRDSIAEILSKNSNINIVGMAKQKKEAGSEPFTILFIGPNGAGKTTTMGKVARMMLDNNLTCVLCASDTFRAAAIEQTAIHAKRLGINVIKGTYGADPASIAFDGVAFARAHNINVVLVDSAGRQETNKNLVEEMKKMVRVAKPDLKIFVGESIAGNALIDQIKTFDESIKLDGVILTKLDVDAKGGNTISVLSETTIPVLFFGIGEAYESLIPYDQKLILDNIVPI